MLVVKNKAKVILTSSVVDSENTKNYERFLMAFTFE